MVKVCITGFIQFVSFRFFLIAMRLFGSVVLANCHCAVIEAAQTAETEPRADLQFFIKAS